MRWAFLPLVPWLPKALVLRKDFVHASESPIFLKARKNVLPSPEYLQVVGQEPAVIVVLKPTVEVNLVEVRSNDLFAQFVGLNNHQAMGMLGHEPKTIDEDGSGRSTTLLIVEQKVRAVLNICNRVHVLRNGAVSFSGPSGALKNDAKLREVYL